MKKKILTLCFFSFLLQLMLGASNVLLAQPPFQSIYGDAKSQGYEEVRIIDGSIYACGRLGDNPNYLGVFSKFDISGNLQWTTMVQDTSVQYLDFVKTRDNAFLVIGRTMPVGNPGGQQFNNLSVMSKISDTGLLLWTRYYDNPGREVFNRIIRLDVVPSDSDHYYVLGAENPSNSPSMTDMVVIYNFDENGNIFWKKRYNGGSDNEFLRSMLPLGSSNFVITGNVDQRGKFLMLNAAGNLAGPEFEYDPRTLVFQDVALMPNRDLLLGGMFRPANTEIALLTRIEPSTGLPRWAITIPGQTRIWHVTELDGDGAFYALGMGIVDGVDRPMVHKFQETSGGLPTLLWSRHMVDGETAFEVGTLRLYNNSDLLYHDNRVNNSKGFGQIDALIGRMDRDFNSCITKEAFFEVIAFELDPRNSQTRIENREIPQPRISETQTPLEWKQEDLCDDCGRIIRDTLQTNCSVDGTFDYTFYAENLSGYDVTGVVINGLPTGWTFSNQFWSAPHPSFPIPDNGVGGPFNVTILPPGPITTPTEICFDVVFLSGTFECCHFTYCITLLPIDPCEEVEVIVTTLESPEGCCYSIDVSNDFCDNYFTGIQTEILTPGVYFSQYGGGSSWTTSVNTSQDDILWTPAGGFIPTGIIGQMRFCLDGITSTTQTPQEIAFHWLALDATGENYIVCSDTLRFECQSCLLVDEEKVECIDNNTLSYTITITNNTTPPVTSNMILLEMHTPGHTFNPNFINVTLASGASTTQTVNIVSTAPLNPGDVLYYKVTLLGDDGWCCHLDSLSLVVPDCDHASPCIDPELINPILCPDIFEPVCGCDGKTYNNACEAQNYYGVTSWTPGPCMQLNPNPVERVRAITLFPNPTTNGLNVQLPEPDDYEVQVLDMNGRVIQEMQFQETTHFQLSLHEQPGGVYYLRIKAASGKTEQFPFVKINP